MSRPARRSHDSIGTCKETSKLQYTSRKQARKARQAGAHIHGNPYLCWHCDFWHLGRYHAAKTRDEYRQSKAGHVHVHSACKELNISLKALLLGLDHMGSQPISDHIPASVLHQLKQLTYR